jgi:hypothetical protein
MAEIEAAKAPHTPNDVEVGQEKAFNRSSDEHEFDEKRVNIENAGEFHEETPKFDDAYNPNVCVPHQSFLR